MHFDIWINLFIPTYLCALCLIPEFANFYIHSTAIVFEVEPDFFDFFFFDSFFFYFKVVFYFFFYFILAIIFMLILTIVIAAITLVERKTLALVQRRVGPSQSAFRGRLQFIADALKLLNKSIFILRDSNRWLFILWPSLALITAYLFWINVLWNPNLAITQIEYNLLVMGVLSFFFSVSILLISFYSKDKYCILSALRSALLMATLELVWGVVVLIVVSHLESFSFASIASVSTRYIILLLLAAPAAPFVLLIFLLVAATLPFALV